ncbi:chorismate mutase [Alkalicoccobacillus porphyridii]|uniref:chorismate mutase n=1 Tax=Alkalicoccobacillus porphyridii TaxID=2597270 RepID=A0A553ZZU8_9BACI|nr:chorismate mutase [Alkalicoccobacillus porphyridii]TSB46916.1 chorismate mutase [Alkalicoccobacillus porphyridii]
MVRGIRGATTVEENKEHFILDATEQLFVDIVKQNNIKPEDVAQVLLTATSDLNAAFPAKAMRRLEGWDYVPVTCAQEINVASGMPLCIRMLMTVNTDKTQQQIKHVYLNNAVKLRPDLAQTEVDS